MREAKGEYKKKKYDYKIAKENLKVAQKELRSLREKIKGQYSAVKQNEKMNNRMQNMQREHFVTPSLTDSLEYGKQNSLYSTQVYHIDRYNGAKNTRINPPRSELYSNINKTYARHLQEKVKAKSKDIAKDTMNMAHQIGDRAKNVAPRIKSSEPEMEM